MNNTLKPLKLTRKDGKIVVAVFYDNSDITDVEILDIKKLKFEGIKTKDISKANIREIVFKGEEKLYLQNKKSKIVAVLPRKHLTKIISTIFVRDAESRHTYLKKEIISRQVVLYSGFTPLQN